MKQKMKPLSASIVVTSIGMMLLVACETRSPGYSSGTAVPAANYPSASETPNLASGFGIVEAIDQVAKQGSGETGVVRTLAEKMYRISLRMDNGTVQTLLQELAPVLRIGDRVRISNGIIERM